MAGKREAVRETVAQAGLAPVRAVRAAGPVRGRAVARLLYNRVLTMHDDAIDPREDFGGAREDPAAESGGDKQIEPAERKPT